MQRYLGSLLMMYIWKLCQVCSIGLFLIFFIRIELKQWCLRDKNVPAVCRFFSYY
jgi:hypothetical protein